MAQKKKKGSSEVELKIVEIIAETLLVSDEAKITPSASLGEDLGADSIDFVEMTMELEERFGVEIDEVAAARFIVVQDVFDYINKNAVPA